jgi:gluconolactonase
MVGLDANSPAIYDLVEKKSVVEQLATGFIFTEGPIWHPAERFSSSPISPGISGAR